MCVLLNCLAGFEFTDVHMYKPSVPIFLIRIKTDEMVNDKLKTVPLKLGQVTRPWSQHIICPISAVLLLQIMIPCLSDLVMDQQIFFKLE